MDPITTAIVTALSAGAVSGLTETSKAAVSDAYAQLKSLLTRKFGASSDVVQAIDHLEARPESVGRKESLEEEITVVNAQQDQDVLAAAQQVLTLLHPQQAGFGKYTVQNNAVVQGQNVGDHHTITQHFGNPPKA
jgi:hypothetical protein